MASKYEFGPFCMFQLNKLYMMYVFFAINSQLMFCVSLVVTDQKVEVHLFFFLFPPVILTNFE